MRIMLTRLSSYGYILLIIFLI